MKLLRLLSSIALVIGLSAGSVPPRAAQPDYTDRNAAPHHYLTRELRDPFTRLKADLESGRIPLDRSSEKAFLATLLEALKVPASSQMLVFSTTSLQLSLITPANPRALYFNEEIYVGYIPDGRIEIISLDPALGAIFYIFDIPTGSAPISIERSGRCMNCHSGSETGRIPGLVIKSVVPGPGGGTLDAFRLNEAGHGIPLEERFGGWYLTGNPGFTNHWGNTIGRLSPAGLARRFVKPGEEFSFIRYPYPRSDVLPQLLHEHQAGFVNRVVEAGYRIRTALHASGGDLNETGRAELISQAERIVRYLLFVNEAPLPKGGLDGDEIFAAEFLETAPRASDGSSLKELDLETQLFRHRCSYMIYSGVFAGLPGVLRQEVYRQLKAALRMENAAPGYEHLPEDEKLAIRRILRETVPELAGEW